MSKNRLLILDGHSLAFRAFFSHAAENFRTTSGVYTNAVYGFASMLSVMIRTEKPSHIAVAFDLSRHSFRTDIYPDYKAGRGETPEEFIGQVENIQRLLAAMGIKWLTMANVEADDIIATLAARGENAGMEVLVSSGDRDSFQLINEGVTVLYPQRSISDTIRLTPQSFLKKYGVTPAQYPELAALTGEKADNLPGVPLVGPKIAAQWINTYGSLDALFAKAGEITGVRGENLRSHVDDVRRNRQLNRLRADLDLPVSLDDLCWKGVDSAALDTICDEFEFNTMRTKLRKLTPTSTGTETAPEVAPINADEFFGRVPSPHLLRIGVEMSEADFEKWLQIPSTESLGLWAIGHIGVNNPRIDWLCIARMPADRPEGEVVLIEPSNLQTVAEKALAAALASANSAKTVYDVKALRHALGAHGWVLNGEISDVNLMDYLADPDKPRLKFAQVTKRLLGFEIAEKAGDITKISEQLTLDLPIGKPEEKLVPQVLENQAIYAFSLLKMRPLLVKTLKYRRLDSLLSLEMPLSGVLQRMEAAGIGVDTLLLDNFAKELRHAVQTASDAAYKSIGREVNLSSPKQLQDVLFNQLGLPTTRKTKTGYSTNAQALEELATYNPHPFLEALLYHRDRIKLLQVVNGLAQRVGDDARIHTTFGQTVTATGRLSSLDPNLQNIPARTDDGQRIREAFVAQKPYVELLTADYSQIEMRIMAHLSEDETLIQAFAAGEDLHRSVAALVYGIDPSEVTATQRSHVKATSYGLAYGLSAFGLSNQLKISQQEASKLMDAYFSRFGKVRDYLNSVVAKARSVGYTETIRGRRRYLPQLRSTNRQVAENARRAALNAPIQGSAADLMKEAMLAVDAALDSEKMTSRVLLQVHDELVCEVAPGERDQLAALIRETMSGVANLRVPLEVSVGIGENWREAAH